MNKRKAGKIAHRLATKVYRKSIRKPKKAVAKLYAAKVGKAKYNQLVGKTRMRKKRGYRKYR